MKLVTVQEMSKLEQAADAAGHAFAAMMENAGQRVAQAIEQRMPIKHKRVLVLVGPGNNGGDGLVAARYLSQAGAQVACYMWKERSSDDPNLVALQEHNIHCIRPAKDSNGKTLQNALRNVDVIIDALLGTGVTRPIEGTLKELLERTRDIVCERRKAPTSALMSLTPSCDTENRPKMPNPLVVAVDVPSGLDCDSGAVDPATLPADLTVTFAAAKIGQFRFPGAQVLGELVVADIGIDPDLLHEIQVEVVTHQTIASLMPPRPMDAHKGTFGKAMIVAGSINYTGAPYLAAAAAARVGTGLVTLAPPQAIYGVLASKLAEATFLLLPHNMGVLVPTAVKVLEPKLKGYAALLIGPGLGTDEETVAFVHQLFGMVAGPKPRQIGFQPATPLSESEPVDLPPVVVDADGLNALAQAKDWWSCLPQKTILTPHPGEMSRLTDLDTDAIAVNRLSTAIEYAGKWGHIVVLKGAFTVIAAPDGRAVLIPFATPALATAGTGDVLAGTITGLLAQGLAPFDAAICGAYLHGLAGQIAAEQIGVAGTLAGDLLQTLPTAMSTIRCERDKQPFRLEE